MNAQPRQSAFSTDDSVAVEQGLLSALLVKPELMEVVSHRLKPHHFSEPLHGIIYAAMASQADKTGTFGASTIVASVKATFADEVAPGISVQQYIGKLHFEVVTAMPKTVLAYAEAIIRHYARNAAMEISEQARAEAREAPDDIAEILTREIQEKDELAAELLSTAERFVSAEGGAADFLAQVEKAKTEGATSDGTFGLKALDSILRAPKRGNLVLVAGRPGMGKSALAVSLAVRMAKAKMGIGFLSLEVPSDEVVCRALADIGYSSQGGSATFEQLLNAKHELSPQQIERAETAALRFQELPILIDDHRAPNLAKIEGRARRMLQMLREAGVEMRALFVDHVGKVAASKRYAGNTTAEMTEISGFLADLAAKLGITVFALCQLNRSVEGRDNKRPMMSDLRDSGALEQDAHVIIFPFREAYYLEKQRIPEKPDDELEGRILRRQNIVELHIAKNRNGATGYREVFCDIAFNRFDDRSVR